MSIPNAPTAREIVYTLDDLRRMAEARNYPRWIVDLAAPHLPRGGGVLEIGGGVGSITEPLLDLGLRVVSIDRNPLCAAYLRYRFHARPVEVVEGDVLDAAHPSLRPGAFDAAVCVNVLEHVADDARALDRVADLLRPGGVLFLMVPAHAALFGSIDRSLGHARRYDRAEILRKTAPRFEAVRCEYLNALGAAAWWWNNRVAGAGRQSTLQIWSFDRLVVPWLSRLERAHPPPFGQSLWFVGRRRA